MTSGNPRGMCPAESCATVLPPSDRKFREVGEWRGNRGSIVSGSDMMGTFPKGNRERGDPGSPLGFLPVVSIGVSAARMIYRDGLPS
jgi:hypothetical protein